MGTNDTWKAAAGFAGASVGVLGAMVYAAMRVEPMEQKEAKDRAKTLVDKERANAKLSLKRKLPKYVLRALDRIEDKLASELWDAYGRGVYVGREEARLQVRSEVVVFLETQADMAEHRSKQEYDPSASCWDLAATELRTAARVLRKDRNAATRVRTTREKSA